MGKAEIKHNCEKNFRKSVKIKKNSLKIDDSRDDPFKMAISWSMIYM